MTHYERAMINFALCILAAAATYATFGASLEIGHYFTNSAQVAGVTVVLMTLTTTLFFAALARAGSELIISRSTWQERVRELELRKLETMAKLKSQLEE